MPEQYGENETFDLPVSTQLEVAIPDRCAGCDTAYEVCTRFGRQVIQGQLTLDEAKQAVGSELETYCQGVLVRPNGWGTLSEQCRFVDIRKFPIDAD